MGKLYTKFVKEAKAIASGVALTSIAAYTLLSGTTCGIEKLQDRGLHPSRRPVYVTRTVQRGTQTHTIPSIAYPSDLYELVWQHEKGLEAFGIGTLAYAEWRIHKRLKKWRP